MNEKNILQDLNQLLQSEEVNFEMIFNIFNQNKPIIIKNYPSFVNVSNQILFEILKIEDTKKQSQIISIYSADIMFIIKIANHIQYLDHKIIQNFKQKNILSQKIYPIYNIIRKWFI